VAQITSNDELSMIVNQFPAQIDYSFGYGSAVLHQQNSNPSASMVDIIMSVSDPHQWHTDNLKRHPDHYSMISRLGGPSIITWLQTNFGAKLYFHPYVNLNIDGSLDTREIKYGVVSTSDLISDLRHWDYLYLAGRMQKPIVTIKTNKEKGNFISIQESNINNAQQDNLLAAVSASLLLISGESVQSSTSSSLVTLPTSKLYTTIASLSYTGDIRMQTGAEDPNKIKKLVDTPGMLDLWEAKYSDTLSSLQQLGLLSLTNELPNERDNYIKFDPLDPQTRKQLMKQLPPKLRRRSDQIIGLDGQKCAQQGSIALRSELTYIVAPAARTQTIKGIFTAGPLKSWKYAMAKLQKGRLKK
jgi:translocator assembly and maintenance protein 41